jgi:protein tyrosine/serine phosphatase
MTDVLHPQPPLTAAPRFRRTWIVTAIVIVFALAAFPAYWAVLIYRANWGVVVPGHIFRSAQMTPLLMRHKIASNHIAEIIFLSHDDDGDADVQAEKQGAAEDHVQFLNFPMNGDGVATPEMYTRALLALCDADRAGKTVLVHCHSGAQRTGGVIAVYRMLVQKMPPEQALAEMRYYGHDPRKNLTLIPFLNLHMGEWAAALVKAGVIDRVPDPLPQLNPK